MLIIFQCGKNLPITITTPIWIQNLVIFIHLTNKPTIVDEWMYLVFFIRIRRHLNYYERNSRSFLYRNGAKRWTTWRYRYSLVIDRVLRFAIHRKILNYTLIIYACITGTFAIVMNNIIYFIYVIYYYRIYVSDPIIYIVYKKSFWRDYSRVNRNRNITSVG